MFDTLRQCDSYFELQRVLYLDVLLSAFSPFLSLHICGLQVALHMRWMHAIQPHTSGGNFVQFGNEPIMGTRDISI